MSSLRLYMVAVTREAFRTAWTTISVLGVIGGATVAAVARDAIVMDLSTLVADTLILLAAFTIIGGYRAWKAEWRTRECLDRENHDLHDRLQNAAPTLIGGAGGAGGDGSGSIGSTVIGGNGGGGGGAAYGPGSVAQGGQGGRQPRSTFERLARLSLGMGYTLDEFITHAGFDPLGPELDRIGVGGDGGSSDGNIPPTDGGPGLVFLSGQREPDADGYSARFVSVVRLDGQSTIWSRRVVDGVLEPPNVERIERT